MTTHVKNRRKTVEEKINAKNLYDLNQRYNGIAWKLEIQMYVNLSTFLALKIQYWTFLTFWAVEHYFLIKSDYSFSVEW